MKMIGPAGLVVIRSILLQQAALRQPDKSRSHTAKGPGIIPHHKSQPAKLVIYRGAKRKMRVPRLMRAEGPKSLDADTARRREIWLKKQLACTD